MLERLHETWRARRVVLIGGEAGMRPWLEVLLKALGAQTIALKATDGREKLSRAMQQGRVSAVMICRLTEAGGLYGQLEAAERIWTEAREAGIPFVLICSEAEVYRGEAGAWYPSEQSLPGGRTREGLFASMVQLYAEGFSRGLLGDRVNTIIVRHMPCLGCGGEAVRQAEGWCEALRDGRPLRVDAPEQQGVFLHPLDAACGALALGACCIQTGGEITGPYNLGVSARNLSANRNAAERLAARHGGSRMEEGEAGGVKPLLLDGSRARRLCRVKTRLSGDEALDARLRLVMGEEDEAQQTQRYLERMQKEEQAGGRLF